ncbi:MAG: hypothetical protein FWE40_04715 [Oscillospiraceae bacterium]|nr:hypothetical protein [Oscillospiraceae bacterium]
MKVAKIVSLLLVIALVFFACAQPQATEETPTTVQETAVTMQETQLDLMLGLPPLPETQATTTTAARERRVFIIANGVEHELPGQVVHAFSDGMSASVMHAPVQQFLDAMPRIPYAEDFQVWVDGQPAQGWHRLLDENAQWIPIDERHVLGFHIGEPFPADEGIFILVVSVSRGTSDNMGMYAYYAKIVLGAS